MCLISIEITALRPVTSPDSSVPLIQPDLGRTCSGVGLSGHHTLLAELYCGSQLDFDNRAAPDVVALSAFVISARPATTPAKVPSCMDFKIFCARLWDEDLMKRRI